jgi:hypothetical protein
MKLRFDSILINTIIVRKEERVMHVFIRSITPASMNGMRTIVFHVENY